MISYRSSAMLSFGLYFCLTLITGCGGGPEGPKRYPIKGDVTREGVPIDEGSILFTPTAGGPAASAVIMNGKYEFDEENGVPAGKYAVKVSSRPNYDKSFEGRRNEAPILPDPRFKKPIPASGWALEAEVTETEDQKIDFAVDPS